MWILFKQNVKILGVSSGQTVRKKKSYFPIPIEVNKYNIGEKIFIVNDFIIIIVYLFIFGVVVVLGTISNNQDKYFSSV